MKRSELTEKIIDLFDQEIVTTQEEGQREYASENNAFSNFEKLASELQIDKKKILWVYAMKHKDGISSFLNGHTSQRESVTGRIKDLIIYLFILWAMIDEERIEGNTIRIPITGLTDDQHDLLVTTRMNSMLNAAFPGPTSLTPNLWPVNGGPYIPR